MPAWTPLLLAAWLCCTSALAQPAPAAELELSLRPAQGSDWTRDVVLRLRDAAGAPLRQGVVEVTADMPSMPMAHRLPRVRASATGEPGVYVARLPFEMAGEWAVKVDILAPVAHTAVRRVTIR